MCWWIDAMGLWVTIWNQASIGNRGWWVPVWYANPWLGWARTWE